MSEARNLREERVARAVDREISPVWHDRFARLLWRHLPRLNEGLVLDVHCGPGNTTVELLERLPAAVRVIALEPNAALRRLAKARISPESNSRVYLKAGDMTDVADTADDTYDLVIANLVLGEAHDRTEVLRGLCRVTKPGGTILASVPMDGTWSEPEDLLREVLRDAGLDDALERMQRLANLRPTGNELAAVMQGLGVGPHHYVIEQERFSLLFRSGREFLFSPLIEFGPLRLWKAIIGPQGNPQELFWRLKESIDTYFAGHVFSATVLAGVLHLRVPETGAASAHAAAETAGEYWRSYPELDAVFQSHEDAPQARSQSQSQAQTQTQTEDMDIDIDMDLEVEPDLMLEPEPDEDGTTRPHPFIRPAMTAEDAAMLALLDQPEGSQADAELDALLDQVLEFAGTTDAIEELSEDEVEEVPEVRKPGETLKRIRALLPPPPSTPGAPPLDNTNEGE